MNSCIFIKRKILPVGQGAFYVEKLNHEGISIIYDCGSKNKHLVEKEIEKNFKKGEIIHALIISHLHEDHINGIPYLLEYCKVERIFFPLISSENKILMRISLEINKSSNFTINFLSNPNSAINNLKLNYSPSLYQIREHIFREENIKEYEKNSLNSNYYINNTKIKEIDSGYNLLRNISIKNITDWLYIPFNFRNTEKIKILKEALYKKFGKELTITELQNLWKNKIDQSKIKEAYKSIGNFNSNSMTVFSGTLNEHWQSAAYAYVTHNNSNLNLTPIDNFFSGCLYLGDYNARSNMGKLQDAYHYYWYKIGCIQIPHHGSKNNFCEKLIKDNCLYFISVGNNNYNHPSKDVTDKLKQHNNVFIVKEDKKSKLTIIIGNLDDAIFNEKVKSCPLYHTILKK